MQSALLVLKTLLQFPFLWLYEWIQYGIAIKRWYRCDKFLIVDLHCLVSYLFSAPYLLCRRYLRQFPDDQVQRVYGETSFTSLDTIMQHLALREEDVVYDLGCGRGRCVFFLRAVYGCKVVGIDLTPTFVTRANRIAAMHGITDVTFDCANVMDYDFTEATVIYIYASAFKESAIVNLADALRRASPGTRIASVTFPLDQYTDEPYLKLVNELALPFSWGKAQVFLYEKIT